MQPDRKPLLLIVDDNPQNLQLLGDIVEKNGFEPALALSGKQALEYVLREKPDLILLDIMMPEMDGYEVCKRLKSGPGTKNIPIIFLTAKAETEDVVKGFEAGGVDYVSKPFNSMELMARVKAHVELKLAREEIQTLRGIVPICAVCKSIRDENGRWWIMEEYVTNHTEAEFSHGLCPVCVKKIYPQFVVPSEEKK